MTFSRLMFIRFQCEMDSCCVAEDIDRVRDRTDWLTLILLTWRIWGAPNNANKWQMGFNSAFNPLNPELNPICYLLALLGAQHFIHVSTIRVKLLTLRY